MDRAVFGLKTTGEPVVSELSSRSSEMPGASEPEAEQKSTVFFLTWKNIQFGVTDKLDLINILILLEYFLFFLNIVR